MKITKLLAHMTTEENCKKIKEENKFIPSVHTNTSIQWLGNGVYFWDSNDDNSTNIGYQLVKNKKGNANKKVQKIMIIISILEENYMNLDDEKWDKKFGEFLDKTYPDGKKLLSLLEGLKRKKIVRTSDLNQVGLYFGKAINLFNKILEANGVKIDLVSHYFYHKKIYGNLYSRPELYVRQYCVKNCNIINQIKSSDWMIEYID